MTAGWKRRLARPAGLAVPEGMAWRSTLVARLEALDAGRAGREVAARLMRRLRRLERAAALRREPYVLVISKGGRAVRIELVPPVPAAGPGDATGRT